ncbi:phage protein GemA/Gp16 family protein [Solimonas flava]|uniref:phage protein GemA/Gp16 family protein n=1 Tax=Solimonas flava TaxID=415849 RepID=UPI0003FFC217|nr:phage protein GemA/Gp16 family protein [Solimonas flava]
MSGAKARKPARNVELGKIHILKAKLGLSDEQYRAMLWANGRVESSAQLDEHGRRKVIAHLQAHVGARDRGRRPHNLEAADRRDLRKIEALLADAGRPWEYAEGILRHMTSGRVERIEFADAAQRRALIAALWRDAKRRADAQPGDA